jgi:uncharacterized protein YkwD
MKNFKRIIAVVTALSVMLTLTLAFDFTTVSAQEFSDVSDSAAYSTAVGLLTSLGVIAGYEDGTFRPDNTITRAEAATIMVRALGRESQAKSSKGATKYSDVSADNWASGYINVASDMGIIVGFPEGTFLPDSPVTYEQIVKMIVCAIGHDVKADANGGYPNGYLQAASTAGVTKGVGGSIGQAASRATVARLIYNSLEIEMMEATGFSTGLLGTTYTTNGKTILNDYLNLEKVDATVEKTYLSGDTYTKKNNDVTLDITKVYGSSDHVSKASYEKGESYVFDAGDTDVAIYLGYAITAYVGEDEETGEDTVFAVTLAAKNNEVEIDSDKLNESGTSDSVISYVKKVTDRKYTTLSLDKKYTLVVNGQIVSDSIEDYFDEFDVMTVVDNDNDDVYEFVFISAYTSDGVEFVVTDIDSDRYSYYFEGKNDSFEVDLDEDDVLYSVVRDGKTADLDDIAVGDTITVLDTSRDIITIYASSEYITGTIDTYDDDENEYTIASGSKTKTYTLSPAYTDSLDVGDSGTFYINYLGKIAYSTVSSTVASGDYVFITNYDTSTSWNKTSYLVQVVTASGSIKTYTIKSTKVKVIDSKGNVYKNLDAEEAYKILLSEDTDVSKNYSVDGYAGVAKVKVSSSGVLSEIYIPGSYSDFYAQTKYASDNSKEYSAKKKSYGVYDLSGKIVTFNIDKTEKDLVDAVETGNISDFFNDGDSYNFIAYGEKSDDIEAVMITDGIASINYQQHATVITKVSSVTSNGEKTTRYTGITNGKTLTYTVDPDDSFDVEKGNIVLIEVGSDGYISALEVVAATTTDPDDLADALAGGDVPTDEDADVYAGLVVDKNSRNFTIEDVNDRFYHDTDSAYALIDYTAKETQYTSSTFSNIKVTSSIETFAVVRLYEDTVIDVFIFRMNAGTYGGGSANVWDNITTVDDEEPTAATTAPTEATTAPTEATTAATEASTEATTEAVTEAPTETATTTEAVTEAPTEATTATEAVTEAPTEAATTTEATENETISLSGLTTETATLPTVATNATEKATTATEATKATEVATKATEAATEATTEAPTEAPTEPATEATTEAPTEPATEATTEVATTATESATTPEEPSEKPAEPTEAPTEPATEAPTVATEATTEAATKATEIVIAVTEATTAPTEAATNAAGAKLDTKTAKSVLDLVNAERAKENLPALKWNATLAKAAENHSLDMATNNYYSHISQDGRTFDKRLIAAGVKNYSWIAENIAKGQRSATEVMDSWMNSTLHRENILSANFTEIGIALAISADGQYYWTQEFLG